MIEVLIVGCGGFLGACARYGLTKLMAHGPTSLPYGTLLSNVLAGLLIGFIIGVETQTGNVTPRTKLFLVTGILGGLSTFSTFSLETVNLLSAGQYALGLGNVILNLSLSLLGVVLGMAASKVLIAA